MTEALRIKPQEMVTAKEAAVYLGVSYYSLLQMTLQGQIKHMRIGPKRGRIRFRVEALDEFLLEQEKLSSQPRKNSEYKRGSYQGVKHW